MFDEVELTEEELLVSGLIQLWSPVHRLLSVHVTCSSHFCNGHAPSERIRPSSCRPLSLRP